MTILCGGIVIVWLVGCVWLIWQFVNSPEGVEIPYVGFVTEAQMKATTEQLRKESERLTAAYHTALDQWREKKISDAELERAYQAQLDAHRAYMKALKEKSR